MASSGQIVVYTESVDWPNYTRGACTLTNTIGWSVNNSGVISFWSIDSHDNCGGNWGVCTTSTNPNEGYVIMEVQVNYGGGWQTVTSSRVKRAVCSSLTNAVSASLTCISGLGTPTLTGNCTMRILYYADLNPHPSSTLQNAFPSESYSAEVQVPVVVEVNWTSTLKYNANGGIGAPSDQTHSNSSSTPSYAETVSSTVPTRENYRFEGWADSASSTTAQYQPGDTVTIQKSSPTKTIYAVWTEFYRPGAVFYSTDDTDPWTQVGEYDSHNRTAGNARILATDGGTVWTEMRTIGAPTELGDTPSIFHDDKWYNQKKLGKE